MDLKDLMEMIVHHERVSNFNIQRAEIKSVNDEGWIESQQADQSYVTFMIDHSDILRPKRNE